MVEVQERVELPVYYSVRVRELYERAYHKCFGEHKVTRSIVSPCGTLASWRCQKPGAWTFGFDVISSGATLFVTGDIGSCMWTREPNMLAWFGRSWGDLDYLAGKSPHCIQKREYCERRALSAIRERLIEVGRTDDPDEFIEEFGVENEVSFYHAMANELNDEEPQQPQDYTTEYVFCTAAVKWLIDNLPAADAKGGA
jgi:hypothetical protein